MLVFNFDSFGSTDAALFGSGTIGLADREPAMVDVRLDGPSDAQSLQGANFYTASLMAFEPDGDQMTAHASGGYPVNYPGPITFDVNPVSQQGTFLAVVPLPTNLQPGEPISCTMACSATETCASDANKTLTGSASILVTRYSHDR